MRSFPNQQQSRFFCISFFAALLLISINCFAQGEKIDSLKKILPKLKDTARIDCLLDLSLQYFSTSEKDSILYYARMAEEESKKVNYIHGLALAKTRKAGFTICASSNFSEAEQLSQEALKWFSLTPNKREIYMAYWISGRSQTILSNYDNALINMKLAYDWASKAGNDEWTGMSLETMTDIYRDRGEYVKLLETQQQLVQRDRKLGDTGSYSFHELWVLGLMYRLLEEYPTALPFWRKLFVESKDGFGWSWNQMEYAELLTQANQPDSALYYYNLFDSSKADIKDLRFFLISKGEYYLYLKQYTAALPYFLKGLAFHRQLDDRRQIKRSLLDIAKTYAALKKNDAAVHYAREGLVMALQTKARPLIRDGYEILYTIYNRLNQSDSAYYYYHNYIATKETVMNEQTRGKLAAYNYEHKIELLGKEKQLQQQQISQAALQRKFLLISIMGILLLGIIVLRNITLKRKNEKQRLEHEIALQKLEAERTQSEFQQKTTELEMQALRAQMNPHFIFNSLNSINRFILQNEKLQAAEYLTKFSKLVRLILQNSQSTLIPLESELEALELYLQLESLRFDHHFDFAINVDDDIDSSNLKVPPLIIQPYAENAIWHGLMHKEEKGHLDIDVTEEQDVLVCAIRDNGVGRKKAAELKSKSAATHKSMGMRITADRIALLKQKKQSDNYITIHDLTLPDGSAGGTEVLLKIPLYQ